MKPLLAFFLLFVCANAFAEAELKPQDMPAPPIELTDLDGKLHSLGDYQDRIVMVQFWATYCTPCRTEMPAMNRLEQALGEKLKILAINMGEQEQEVRKFVDEVKPEFTILLDPKGESIRNWKAFVAPSSFIVTPDGRIRYTLYGPAEWDSDAMKQKLLALLES